MIAVPVTRARDEEKQPPDRDATQSTIRFQVGKLAASVTHIEKFHFFHETSHAHSPSRAAKAQRAARRPSTRLPIIRTCCTRRPIARATADLIGLVTRLTTLAPQFHFPAWDGAAPAPVLRVKLFPSFPSGEFISFL
jgi:hypothetical protein